jgi:hypothetical protein
MTPQEIFDKAYIGVMKQGRASVKPRAGGENVMVCAYRGEDGTACGVGHTVDDETAREWDMIGAIDDVIAQLDDDLPSWVLNNAGLLQRIQHAHDFAETEARDGSSFINHFEEKMRLVAQNHILTVPEVPNVDS